MAALRFATFRWVFKASGELDLLQCNGHIKANFRWQLFLTACLRVCSLCSEPDLCFIKKRNTIRRMNDDSLSLLPRSVKRNFPLILSKTYIPIWRIFTAWHCYIVPKIQDEHHLLPELDYLMRSFLVFCVLSEVKRHWEEAALAQRLRHDALLRPLLSVLSEPQPRVLDCSCQV